MEYFLSSVKDPKKCYKNGAEYENEAKVPTNDPCESCHCYSGEIMCSSEDCAFPDPALNCKEIHKEGSCCPDFNCPRLQRKKKKNGRRGKVIKRRSKRPDPKRTRN